MMQMRRCQPSEAREVCRWIKERHYLRSTPPGFIAVLEFTENGERIGAMIIGRPSSRELLPGSILQLHRMYFLDEAPPMTESRALSMMRRYVRTWLPTIKLVLTYSDPAAGHKGTIYEADNWAQFGRTSHKTGYGWKSRPNRTNDPVTPKLRWLRTP